VSDEPPSLITIALTVSIETNRRQAEQEGRMKVFTEEDKKSLRGAAQLAASLFAEQLNVDYVICAIRRGGSLPEDDISIIATNLTWQDRNDGLTKRPTVGMMTDLLIEARMAEEIAALAQENWRRTEPTGKTQ
jgi:hypothetical protein